MLSGVCRFPNLLSFSTCCVNLELRPLPSTVITRLQRYYGPIRHPTTPSLSLAGVWLVSRITTWQGFPCCVCFPLPDMPSPIPRRNHRLRFPFSSPVTTAFPVSKSGRLPHHPFRGLLSVHSHYGLHVRQVPFRTIYTRGFSRFVTSTSAPVATGWNESCRTGFAPAEKQRLTTAHLDFELVVGSEGQCWIDCFLVFRHHFQ